MDANEKISMKEYKRNYYLKNREKIRQKVKENNSIAKKVSNPEPFVRFFSSLQIPA